MCNDSYVGNLVPRRCQLSHSVSWTKHVCCTKNHRSLVEVYVDSVKRVQYVTQWCREFENCRKGNHDDAHIGSHSTWWTNMNERRVQERILGNQQVTSRCLTSEFKQSIETALANVRSHLYHNRNVSISENLAEEISVAVFLSDNIPSLSKCASFFRICALDKGSVNNTKINLCLLLCESLKGTIRK